jgi:hypothetical protein
MTVSLKHIFQSAKTDSTDTTLIQPSNWNEEHELELATNKLLGRATAGTGAAEEISIGTALSVSGGTLAVTTVPAANGGTGITSPGTSGNVLTSNGTGWTSVAPATFVVNYPQNIQSANYTLVLGDAGKQIFHPASDTTVRTYTIPANSSVAFPIGTVVLFTVENGGTSVAVTINSDTLVNGSGLTGAVTVPANNTLMAIKVTATKWMANFLYQTGTPVAPYQIAVAHDASPYLTAYPWSSSGFGTKYADPGTLPGNSGNDVAFSPAGNAIATCYAASSPFVAAYAWSGAGFGTKYANPATVPSGAAQGIAFSADGNAVALAIFSSPYVNAYAWTNASGFGTRYSNPATLPTGIGTAVAFTPAGDAIAVAHDTTPFVTAYPWTTASGFGVKYTNPATPPTGTGTAVAFTPAGDAIAVSHATTPFVTAYPWNSSTGFGTKYTNPATLPGTTGSGVSFSPAGNAIAVASSGSPYITAYPWSVSGFGTKYTNPAVLPAATGNGVAFSPTGDAIAVAHNTTPFVSAYPWSGSGFGTKYTDPATLPTGTGNDVAFNFSA